jgi:hypothetical protein
MSMRTRQPEDQTGRMTSPDLRFRTSTTIWGPLQLTLTNHREGAELGYEAGQVAYHQDGDYALEDAMRFYLEAPRYRPRTCTPTIIQEWQAMFLLGWTSQLLETTLPARETNDQAQRRRQYEASQPTLAESAFVARGRERR